MFRLLSTGERIDSFTFLPRFRPDDLLDRCAGAEEADLRLLLPVTDGEKCRWLHQFLRETIQHIKSFERTRDVWRTFPRVTVGAGNCDTLITEFRDALDEVNRRPHTERVEMVLGDCATLSFTPIRYPESRYRFGCVWFDRFNLLISDEKALNRNHPAEVIQANLRDDGDRPIVLVDSDGLIFEEDYGRLGELGIDTGGRPTFLVKPGDGEEEYRCERIR